MEPGSTGWWAQRAAAADRPRRPRADGLTLDRILDAALELVDEEGLDGLTMRGLATRLDCGHASLYRHVAGHDEVVVLLVDRVLGTVTLDAAPADRAGRRARTVDAADGAAATRARVEHGLRRYRAALLEHPNLAPAFLAGQLLGPNALARREEGLRLALAAGASPALAARAYLSLTHFVIASVAFESSGAGRTAAERRAMEAYFADLPRDTYPTLVACAAALGAVDADQEFELGLAALLDHLTVLVAAGDAAADRGGP